MVTPSRILLDCLLPAVLQADGRELPAHPDPEQKGSVTRCYPHGTQRHCFSSFCIIPEVPLAPSSRHPVLYIPAHHSPHLLRGLSLPPQPFLVKVLFTIWQACWQRCSSLLTLRCSPCLECSLTKDMENYAETHKSLKDATFPLIVMSFPCEIAEVMSSGLAGNLVRSISRQLV